MFPFLINFSTLNKLRIEDIIGLLLVGFSTGVVSLFTGIFFGCFLELTLKFFDLNFSKKYESFFYIFIFIFLYHIFFEILSILTDSYYVANI